MVEKNRNKLDPFLGCSPNSNCFNAICGAPAHFILAFHSYFSGVITVFKKCLGYYK